MDDRAAEPKPAPLAVPRSAAEWTGKRRMSEHRDVRVRRGGHSASIAGKSNEHDVRSTIATGAMVIGYFLTKQKVARSRSERNRFVGGERKMAGMPFQTRQRAA
jgi:hypothetical protein